MNDGLKGQGNLFYEDEYDAIDRGIASSGKTRKYLAGTLYPDRKADTGMSLFNRIMSPETDVHMNIGQLLKILQETRPDDFIFYLCDRFGFMRPQKKAELTAEERLDLLQERIKVRGLEVLFRDVM